jgi:hypothetical protein
MSKRRRTEKDIHTRGVRKIKHPGQIAQQRHEPFTIRMVNGIEIATATRNADDRVPEGGHRQIAALSEMASRRFAADVRGGFLVVSESDPKATAYLPLAKLAECIGALIPEASNEVEAAVTSYDPSKQFVMVNVVSRSRIAITIDAKRLPPDKTGVL